MTYVPRVSDRSDTARLARALLASNTPEFLPYVGAKVETPQEPFQRLRRHVLVKHPNGERWEYRERAFGLIECPVCGSDIELLQSTEQHERLTDDTQGVVWVHTHYGPAIGECCGVLLFDDPMDGLKAFVPKESTGDSEVEDA